MKSLILIIYVAAVLVFSAFARAELVMPFNTPSGAGTDRSPIFIDHISADTTDLALEVVGRLPNPCTDEPTATISVDENSPNTLTLRLSSPLPTGVCVAPVAHFRSIVSLPETAQLSGLRLDDKAVYLLKVDGHGFEIEVLGSDLMRVPGFYNQ